MPYPSIRLLTRGDDLGAFQSGNYAILDAFQHGILRNASLMVPAPNFAHAAQLVRDLPGLCLGLHVTLTSEWDAPRWVPVSPPDMVPSLLDRDHCFFQSSEALFQHGIVLEEAMREISAQLALARAQGLDIRYLDEHMGVGWLFEQADPQRQRLAHALRQFAHEEDLIWHGDLSNVETIWGSVSAMTERLRQIIPGDYLLITHPAYAGPETHAVVGPAYTQPGVLAHMRAQDYELLRAPETVRIVHERQIQLLRYDELWPLVRSLEESTIRPDFS